MQLIRRFDVFSNKRLLFNIAIYCGYTVIFLISYATAILLSLNAYPVSDLYLNQIMHAFLIIYLVKFFIFNFFNFKRFVLYSDFYYDLYKLCIVSIIIFITIFGLKSFTELISSVPLNVFLFDGVISIIGIAAFNFLFKSIYHNWDVLVNLLFGKAWHTHNCQRVLIIGIQSEAQSVYKYLLEQKNFPAKVIGFVDNKTDLSGKTLYGVPIYRPYSIIPQITHDMNIEHIYLAANDISLEEIEALIKNPQISVSKASSLMYDSHREESPQLISEMYIQNVLSRISEKTKYKDDITFYSGKTILVTGAGGHIGSEICRQITSYNISRLIALDQAELPLVRLANELTEEVNHIRLSPILADITNSKRLFHIFKTYRPEIIFHAADYSRYYMIEFSDEEIILNNIFGTKCLADICNLFQSEKLVMLSNNQVASPLSFADKCKLIAEIYLQTINKTSHTKYASYRFGDTLDSPGNIISIIQKQIDTGGPVILPSNKDQKNVVLTSEVVHSLLESVVLTAGGEVYTYHTEEKVDLLELTRILAKSCGIVLGKDIECMFSNILFPGTYTKDRQENTDQIISTGIDRVYITHKIDFDMTTANSMVSSIIEKILKNDDAHHAIKQINIFTTQYHNLRSSTFSHE